MIMFIQILNTLYKKLIFTFGKSKFCLYKYIKNTGYFQKVLILKHMTQNIMFGATKHRNLESMEVKCKHFQQVHHQHS